MEASTRQISYIRSLASERGVPTGNLEILNTAQASAMISNLLKTPRGGWGNGMPAVVKTVAPEGMHKLDGVIFKVQVAHQGSGNKYAKRLVPGEGFGAPASFEYAPGAIRNLSEDTLLSLEDAKAFGALYGTCCVCGRTLTDETSIAAGIGPICAKRF